MEIKRITEEEQLALLAKKLDDRLKYNLLIDDSVEPEQRAKNEVVLYDLCKNDWKFAVNNFFWLQDPEAVDAEGKVIPFLLWDFQEKAGDEIVKAIFCGYDLPIEKCRKLGLTWLVITILVWGWNFHEWEVLVGSRKMEEVDKRGDIGTLFEKVRFIIGRLPKFMFPTPLNHFSDKVGMILHPKNKATISGEANNPDFGRSDRRKVILMDEFSAWTETDRAAYQACSQTTKCRIPLSTPNRRGTNCWFFQIVKESKRKCLPTLTLPWWLNPMFAKNFRETKDGDNVNGYCPYTSDWLEDQIKRSPDMQAISQEILINYNASMSGKVFPDFDIETQLSEKAVYDDKLPLYVAWDFGLDTTAIMWIQPDYKNRVYNIIDEYQNDGGKEGDSIYHYLDIIDDRGYKTAIHYGDPQSGENRSLTSGQSNASILRRHGIIFRCQKTSIINRVAAGKNLLKQVRINPNCTISTEMFISWQMKNSRVGNGSSSIPEHSEYSHMGDAYTYWAYNFKQPAKDANNKKKIASRYKQSVSGVMI